MKALIAWFADNSVAANLLMLIIVVGGALTVPVIKKEVFPEINADIVNVSVLYPGASPEEVEEAINVRIEEKIAGLEGVKQISSTAAEGVGAVTIEAMLGTDVGELLDDVKSQVDTIDTFPEEAEEAVVSQVTIRRHVLSVAVYGDAGELTLKRFAERVRDELTSLPGITLVELSNARPYEVSIEVPESSLRRFGLSFDQVADAVRRSSLDLPAGSVRTEAAEIMLRTKGQAYTGRDFERLVLLSRPDGTRLYLSDVATVVDGFAETDQSARFNGKPAVMVQVFRVGQQSALEVAEAVKKYVREARPDLPNGIYLDTWRDSSRVLRGRLDTLLRNGGQGLLLVFICLALFLQFRLALWVTMGIPLSFLGALWMFPSLGVSINVLSLFCFILVLGIVVDDAIVVGENVYRTRQRGETGLDAVVKGTQEVAIPVVFGVLTTVAAFLPMLFLPGSTGKMMRLFPLAVIPSLLFSLLESQLILPSHLKHVVVNGDAPARGVRGAWKRFQRKFSGGLETFIDKVYGPVLGRALRWRYLSLSTAVSFLVITVAMAWSGWVSFTFFPKAEADAVVAELTMPQGTPKEATASAVAQLEASAQELKRVLESKYGPKSEGGEGGYRGGAVRHIVASVGEQPYRSAQTHNGGRVGSSFSGAHLGEVYIELAPSEERSFDSESAARRWRELNGSVPDAVELTYSASLFSAGAPIDVRFAGPSIEDLSEAAKRLKTALSAYPGVFDVSDSFRPGKEEIKLNIKPRAEALGLSLADLAKQVRQGFYGEEAQRVQRGREDLKVMVRYPESERRSLATLENMRIRLPGLPGQAPSELPFSSVATVDVGRGYASIQRANRQRVVDVTSEVDPALGNANRIVEDLKAEVLPAIVADYPGLHYSLEGEQREQRETLGSLARGFLIALFVIYALMAIPLRSYLHPLIVMSAIPFGVAGAVWAHFLLGFDVSFLSIFGIVALVGVVVNDSLVLVDYINRHRDAGEDLLEVVNQVGKVRFRPILLTSLTTFAGLTPLLLERSLQAQFLVPMAVSLGFGVIFATGVSLILVPCLYLILEDMKLNLAGLRQSSPRILGSEAEQ